MRHYRFDGYGYYASGEFTYSSESKLGSKKNYEDFNRGFKSRFGKKLTWEKYKNLVEGRHPDYVALDWR